MRASTTLSSATGSLNGTGTLVIERHDFEEVINFARAAGKNEVCGYLLVRRQQPNLYAVISDSLLIPEQTVNAGSSVVEGAGDIEQMDFEEQYDDDPDVFRLLWHSHVTGTPRFSITDTNTHDKMAHATSFDAMFYMVVNTYGEATANLEVYRPFRIGAQLRLVVLEDREEVDLATYKAELAKKCRTFKPKKPAIPRRDDGYEAYAIGEDEY